MTGKKTELLGLSRAQLEVFFAELGEKRFRVVQLIQWVYQRGENSFDKMTDLSKDLRIKLNALACLSLPEVIADQISSDGTRKWLLRCEDGNAVEAVFIPEAGRGTLCVSSQVGCLLTCTFCATARQGFNRNLNSAEIIAQLFIANRLLTQSGYLRPITNVVMMGMGEPLLNYENVIRAMKIMLDDHAYGLSKRRVTLSTAGVVPAIIKLKTDCPVTLAISLHAPNDELRSQLVPINKKYPLVSLMQACEQYLQGDTRRRITFEYVMLDQINDSKNMAVELVDLIKFLPCKVNLIPFNRVSGIDYECSSNNRIHAFREVLQDAGIVTLIRKTRGNDIDAACGQLAGQVKDKTKRSVRLNVSVPRLDL